MNATEHGSGKARVDYARRPMLVFWETTRACGLACRHCRASATRDGLPGQLDTAEGMALLDQIASFGRPHPILVLTGGDCLLRPDLFDLIARARELQIPTALSPSVTPALTDEAIDAIVASDVSAVSISLDGSLAATHDGVRGIPGHLRQTLTAIARLVGAGLTVQVNTTVMRANLQELPDIAALVHDLGVRIWEVFFLVPVGRGTAAGELDPEEYEAVCHFLYDASHYGVIVRTVEAPFFRRVVAQRRAGLPAPRDPVYESMSIRLRCQLGEPRERASAHTAATRDGKGIVFVAHDGEVYPAGFLPVPLGNVRQRSLADLYTGSELLLDLRAARFAGRCGRCEFADLCGGSRARAFAVSGDLLGEDPACAYQPPALGAAAPRGTSPDGAR